MSNIRSSEVPITSADEVWHADAAEDVLRALNTRREGLTKQEVHTHRRTFGRNEFTQTPEPNIFKRIITQLRSPLAFVLVAAFVVTIALAEYIDAAVIFFALFIAVVVGILQEGKASRAFKKLADSQVQMATVIRDGEKHEINAADVVVGDIVEIQSGQQVPADIRLFEVKKLEVNEAAFTGEWVPVRKHVEPVPIGAALSERENMLWMGTYAVEGYGRGVVVAVGDETEVGELAQNLHAKDEATPLQEEMRRISRIMLYIITALVLCIFVMGVFLDHSLTEMLLMSIAIAVASIPEGLPAAVTIVLAVGMETLLKRGGLVRNLLAAETLGSTTFVLTDKTGTLTMARMAMTGVIHNDATNFSPQSWGERASIRQMFETALCASDAYADATGEKVVLRGDPIERAILEAAEEIGIHAEKDSWRAARTDFLAFTSENRFAAGLVPHEAGNRLCVNGAPEHLLALATHVYEDGKATPMTPADRYAYEAAISAQTKEGKRLIAVAYKDVTYASIPEDELVPESLIERDLVFMGIFIFNDPVRKRVGAAIAGVQDAGATVLLVTGDNRETALSVAKTVGIAGPHETAFTGADIAELSDDELYDAFREIHVFARILPKQKMRIAQVLQSRGEIVAMTGDGINDAPALRRANIGIAVGSGTEVAKEAADLILIDDSFEIIYSAIEEGRRIVSNLRKIVGYLLSTSLSEVLLIGAALATGSALPLVPAQILWSNLIEEGLMSFAFAFEKGEKDSMKRMPQDVYEGGILSSMMFRFLTFTIVVQGTLLLSVYFYLRSLDVPLEELRSVMFMLISVDSLFMAFAFRSLTTPIWQISFWSNRFFLIAVAVNVALLGLVVTVPFLQYLLSFQPLPF